MLSYSEMNRTTDMMRSLTWLTALGEIESCVVNPAASLNFVQGTNMTLNLTEFTDLFIGMKIVRA